MGGDAVVKHEAPSAALAGDAIELPDGFRCELLYSVPKESQGSWVVLCEDGRGRLIAGDQNGALYRIEVGADASATRVERLALDLGRAQGLCWAFDSLYVVVAEGEERERGLYRVRDSNGDGERDDVKLLRKFDGGGEHGPHAVVLAPDGEHLWVIAGNHTKPPEPIDVYRMPKTWGEDHLLPVIEDPNGHAVGIRAPGGWVARTDANGERWELWCGGMRNAYDLAFDAYGEAFTYDSDMEWDIGAPWYKPPRVLHLVSGADFGWRSGTANWPVDYPDTLPSVCETGPASPTGVVFGTKAKFPRRYRSALFALDWAYGTIYEVHTLTGQYEKFATGKPFPVTDLVIARDGAMYVTTGGRKTQSGLYRITWNGPAEDRRHDLELDTGWFRDTNSSWLWNDGWSGIHAGRSEGVDSKVISKLLDEVGSAARLDALAARVALEHLPFARWSDALSQPFHERRTIQLVIAALHAAPLELREAVLETIDAIPLERLPWGFEPDALRIYELALLRLDPLAPEITTRWRARLEAMYPSAHERTNRGLAMLLVYLESPKVIEPLLATLESDAKQEEKIHAAYCLRALKSGWSMEQRQRFFVALDALRKSASGGHSLVKYVEEIRKQSVDALGDDEKRELGALVETPAVASSSSAPAATFVKHWTVDELLAELREPLHARSFDGGKSAYAKASCAQCHRIGGEGGATGPDLTGAGSRFSARDLVEAIAEPSKAISDQYQDVEVRTVDGDLYVGRVEGERDGKLVFRRLPPSEDVVELELAQIESRRLHPLSRMPSGLLDVLTRDEVLDLFAYVLSGAAPDDGAFR
jgi:putative heme-binding domain-containing protein